MLLFLIIIAYSILNKHYQQNSTTFNVAIEGFFLFIIYSHMLFNIDVDKNLSIYKLSDFWISIGILTFYGSTFVFFVIYPLMKKLYAIETNIEYDNILRPLNLFFYICIIIGLICSIRNKNFLTR